MATVMSQFCLKRTRGCTVTIGCCVAENLYSEAKQKTCHIPHVHEYHKRKRERIQEFSD